jgi:uncharacterized protein (DUF2141 family)
MGPPGGGPEDKTPPEILEAIPASGSTRLDPESRIELTFSEPVDPGSVQQALFVSPPQTRLEFDVNGSSLIINPSDPIPEDRPLIITAGSGLRDLHGNKLGVSRTFVFTAGEKIPGGAISGKVYSATPTGDMLVGVWKLSDDQVFSADTIAPQFLTQAGESGQFRLEFLPSGTYRTLAWDDKNGDRKYAAGVDRMAISSYDVVIETDSQGFVDLFAAKRDTVEIAPVMLSCPDTRHLQLRLTKSAGSESAAWLESLTIVDSNYVPVTLGSGWVDPSDSAKLVFVVNGLTPDALYRGSVKGDTLLLNFAGSSVPDTFPPKVAAWLPRSGLPLPAEEQRGRIAFDDALDSATAVTAISVVSGDSTVVNGRVSLITPNVLEWVVSSALSPDQAYSLKLSMGQILDLSGNAGADTTLIQKLTIEDPTDLGEISGAVIGASGRRVVVAVNRVDGGRIYSKQTIAEADGKYQIEGLSAGRYVPYCWEDRNRDGSMGLGELNPFEFSEVFTFSRDTVTVRARWTTQGVDLILPHKR